MQGILTNTTLVLVDSQHWILKSGLRGSSLDNAGSLNSYLVRPRVEILKLLIVQNDKRSLVGQAGI